MARIVVFIYLFFVLSSYLAYAQDDNETISTTTPTTTTTTSEPQENQEQETETAEEVQSKSHCTCDLTVLGCDVDCCCDPDCRFDDRSVFSCCCIDTCDSAERSDYCDDVYSEVDDALCVKERVIYMENTAYKVTETDNGLFCVYTDNYDERNYYETPDLVTDSDEFDKYLAEYGTSSYKPETTDTPGPDPTEPYKSGDAMYTVYENEVMGLLALPSPLNSQTCVDSNPAAFLYDEHHECVRSALDVEDLCGGSSLDSVVFDAKTYYKHFKIVPSPTDFVTDDRNVTEDTNEDTFTTVSSVDDAEPTLYDISIPINANGTHTCIDENGHNDSCSFGGDLPSPQLEGGFCTNMVVKVVYDIQHNSTGGVTAAMVTFTMASVSVNVTSQIQEFQSRYTKLGQGDTLEVSGRPGYHVNEPVLAGVMTGPDEDELYTVTVSGNRDQMFTIVKSGMDGMCGTSTANREAIKFGVDMRSGCYVQATYTEMVGGSDDICNTLQDVALDALLGPEPRPTYVGTYGDSNSTITGDWVEIIQNENINAPSPIDGGSCGQLVMGLHVELLYANVGDVGNPQPKIIGVKYIYTRRDVSYQCVGGYCMPGTEEESQKFEVISSVGFIDVSVPAVGVSAEQPTVSARLPEDFFYPFS